MSSVEQRQQKEGEGMHGGSVGVGSGGIARMEPDGVERLGQSGAGLQ